MIHSRRDPLAPLLLAAALLLAAVGFTEPTLAWGSKGHKIVNRAAMLRLPADVPAFVRASEAIADVEALGPELDRIKGAGKSADANENPGHYVDLDDGCGLAGVRPEELPATRAEYATLLRKSRTDEFKIGFLPYALLDGWQRIRRDFAWWRVDVVGERRALAAADRAWFKADRKLRERLVLRDIGVWGHYVADGSQPLHSTIHFNGWGNFPNPAGYSTDNTLHARFEDGFVNQHSSLSAVLPLVSPYAASDADPQPRIAQYLETACRDVVPLYELEKASAFEQGRPEAIRFVEARLARGASMMRDLIADAWRSSARESVGWPAVSVADFESGKQIPARGLFDH